MGHMSIKFILFVFCCVPFPEIFGKLTCDVETYVLAGLEFSRCHQSSMEHFADNPVNVNPCPVIKHLLSSCSEVLRSCYDERGWVRGREALLKLLMLQFPDQNECDVFNKDSPNTDIPQQLPDEKCSINDEVALMQEMRTCSQEAQTEVLKALVETRPVPQTDVDRKRAITEVVCGGLNNVSQTCFVAKLPDCYSEEESRYHLAFLLEELRLTGITLISHLSSVGSGSISTNNSTTDHDTSAMSDVSTVEQCPVFSNGPLSIYISHQNRNIVGSSTSGSSTTILAIILTLVFVGIIGAVGYLVVTKSRLGPIIRARFDNTPYTDFESNPNAQGGDPQVTSSPGAAGAPKPGMVSITLTHASGAPEGGPSS